MYTLSRMNCLSTSRSKSLAYLLFPTPHTPLRERRGRAIFIAGALAMLLLVAKENEEGVGNDTPEEYEEGEEEEDGELVAAQIDEGGREEAGELVEEDLDDDEDAEEGGYEDSGQGEEEDDPAIVLVDPQIDEELTHEVAGPGEAHVGHHYEGEEDTKDGHELDQPTVVHQVAGVEAVV